MNKILAISLACFWASTAFAADDGRWVTFKTGHNSQGALLHQIDRNSVRQEGPYKSFWTRIWLVKDRQPLVFSRDERIFFLSQKFLVDCRYRRFGARFVDSNQPEEMRRKTSLAAMSWEALDKVPPIGRSVCGVR